ncbi:MAG: hypothetical protein HZB55_08915 [Deltaproteobacteria bacterium]|nr:hypothetical protein [Deltaproteobacteria bacterium]
MDSPKRARSIFKKTKAHELKDEKSIVKFLEDALGIIEDVGGRPLAERYFQHLKSFIEKFSLRYDLQPPCTISPTLPGVFASLVRDLRSATSLNAHLAPLMEEFDDAIRDLKNGTTQARIKTCLQKQMNLMEAMGGCHPGVRANTLNSICDQLGTWPHNKVRSAMKDLYSFASDYPGIRHGGTPANAIRPIEMRDMVALTVLLTGFSAYLTDKLDPEAVYGGA